MIFIILPVIIFFWKIFPSTMFLTAHFAQTPIGFTDLLFMKFRKIDVTKVCNAYIQLTKAGVDIKIKELETAYLLNHDLENIAWGLILSKQKNIPLTLEQAKEADRKGIKMVDELKKIQEG